MSWVVQLASDVLIMILVFGMYVHEWAIRRINMYDVEKVDIYNSWEIAMESSAEYDSFPRVPGVLIELCQIDIL